MYESFLEYGPTPFRMFYSWFKMEGFDKFLEKSWKSMNLIESNAMICLKKKFQLLKYTIKNWSKENKAKLNATKTDVQKNFDSIEFLELSQKVKVRWAIEGDENSKYFHGILNNKRSPLAICGIIIDRDWIVDPRIRAIKDELHRGWNLPEAKDSETAATTSLSIRLQNLRMNSNEKPSGPRDLLFPHSQTFF
nr:hypothetical protein [Tanacetum cinerariifolium]